MFTNGMYESNSSQIFLRDVSYEALKVMLQYMYNGELDVDDTLDVGFSLIQLLLLADQFGVVPLHQECCKTILECLSEVASNLHVRMIFFY